MCNNVKLQVSDLSVKYLVGDFRDIGLKDYVVQKLTGRYSVSELWANKGISFSINEGDFLGIIGKNGAGKSTLLKVISGIMEPTKGSVVCNGKIASLLELSSGFDEELTVKENTFLRGALLGYSKNYMCAKYESIIDFAELKDSENRPFKYLSSGMKSRLAFSIASLLEPDILILDEVLSVGDGAFRKKSETRMMNIINNGATTILVSHSLEQIRSLCNKVLWLDHGNQIAFSENVQDVCNDYQTFLDNSNTNV